jgi:two-component system chemotaxis sensor kinase CheA
LIFLPGFSTAEKVTNVSGRGVGMDVVKTNVEKIGGTVDVQSTLGRGTTVRVKIPLTLAIIPALVVTCGGDRYAIPQVSLLELVRLEADEVAKGIDLVHGAPVYRLRGRLLPLVYLNQELKLAADARPPAAETDGAVNIVVLQADERQFGLVVDQINDTEEIVVKPLRKQLKTVKTFAGSSIMGDGKVALILDVLGLAQRASVVTETRDRAMIEKVAESETADGRRKTNLPALRGKGRRKVSSAAKGFSINRIREIRVRSVCRSARLHAPVIAICSTTLPQCSSSGTTHCISRRWEISHDLCLDRSTLYLRERQRQKTRLALRPEVGHPNLRMHLDWGC